MKILSEKIRFQIEVSRILDILSKQIYDSPYALLRENAQNAYDAVLIRKFRDPSFQPLISIEILPNKITIADNGIGMTYDELKNNFWRAGSSGKNTSEAKQAGVVGTFGIGGLANFGICKTLTVVSEPVNAIGRTTCTADRDTLSLETDSIIVDQSPPTGKPGTTVIATLPTNQVVDVKAAESYVEGFLKHVHVPIELNGRVVSMKPLEESCPSEPVAWSRMVQDVQSGNTKCSFEIRVSETGNVWIKASRIVFNGSVLEGELLLRQGYGQIMALRSGFGLSRAAVSSSYTFGGVADMKVLQPTAGRDALTTASIQTLQYLVSSIGT